MVKSKKKSKIIIEAEALSLFLQGVKIQEIAKQLKRHHKTIGSWRKRYHWDKAKEKVEEIAIQQARETLDERKERMLRIAKAIQGKFIDKMLILQ